MTMPARTALILTLIILATPAALRAQPAFVGVQGSYIMATQKPDTIAVGDPARATIGVAFAYRIEQVNYQNPNDEPFGMVIEPKPNELPTYTLSVSAVELSLGLSTRVAQLDDSLSGFYITLLGMLDQTVGGTLQYYRARTDVPDRYVLVEEDVPSSTGWGFQIGPSIILPLGKGRVTFDVLYAWRRVIGDVPSTSWLSEQGVRLGVGYVFGL
jgi:hypothetical protein